MTNEKDVIFEKDRMLLRCLNCETYFPFELFELMKVPVFCSNACLEESKLVRKLRRLGKTFYEDKSIVLASISTWFDIVSHFKNNESSKRNYSDIKSMMNAMIERVGSDTPLKRCDDEVSWLKVNRHIAMKRARYITNQKDPDELINLILSLKNKGLSDHLVAKALTEKGILTATGKRSWRGNSVKKRCESYFKMKDCLK